LVLGPEKSDQPTLIWIHGGGGCRKMFEFHARELAKKNYRSVLIDLPGHGSRIDEKLSAESAI
jgi:pimeloyl-ACP methyl ester carboxylesterase